MTTTLTTIELRLGGMTCASCAARIEKRLNRLDGVISQAWALPLGERPIRIGSHARRGERRRQWSPHEPARHFRAIRHRTSRERVPTGHLGLAAGRRQRPDTSGAVDWPSSARSRPWWPGRVGRSTSRIFALGVETGSSSAGAFRRTAAASAASAWARRRRPDAGAPNGTWVVTFVPSASSITKLTPASSTDVKWADTVRVAGEGPGNINEFSGVPLVDLFYGIVAATPQASVWSISGLLAPRRRSGAAR